MINVFLRYINGALLAASIVLAAGSAFFWLSRPSEIEEIMPVSVPPSHPKNSFTQSEEAYSQIKEPIYNLHFQPPSIKIPDLKNVLFYYGKNGRPDADSEKPELHFALAGGKGFAGITSQDKLYLLFNKKSDGSRYSFSPNNEETTLWIEAKPQGQEVAVTVHLLDEEGTEVLEPDFNRSFALAEKEYIRNMAAPWEMGKWRVDATLLARMRTHWYGPDKFLEEHGGDEFKNALGKHRIDFGEGEDAYSVFVKQGDALIFKGDRWQEISAGPESLLFPLLVVKKVDERLMNLELWDMQGKGKVALNLLKSSDNFPHDSFNDTFKFLGARTRSQFLFEIDAERMLIRPQDWLILTEEGWKKITTVKEIDDYVERKLKGTLFVFDKIVRKDDKQIIQGTVYNPHRTESYLVELAMQPALVPGSKGSDPIQPGKEKLEAMGKSKFKIEPPSYAKQK